MLTYVTGDATNPKGPGPKYDAIARCLGKVADHCVDVRASLHIPRIGAGLAGGSWDRIEPLILERVAARGVVVTVYDLPR